MRNGFTTGSCAAAAAKAAAYMIFTDGDVKEMSVVTPKGVRYDAKITDITRQSGSVRCGVVKDGGDDPDVTTGTTIYASVSLSSDGDIVIDGGDGVGRVTKPGLDQPVGNAAINSVPRRMIEDEVREVLRLFDYDGGVRIIISVKDGEALAAKTFNPNLGIVGGISIIGTTGIVEPMSTAAVLDTIRVTLRQQAALGNENVVIAPGNYGLDFANESLQLDTDRIVKCSNFIGDTIDIAADEGIKNLLLVGHIGKLIKLTGGIMNTYSKEADCRMELMAATAVRAGADAGTANDIMEKVTASEALKIIKGAGLQEAFTEIMMERADMYLKKRAAGRVGIEAVIFSPDDGMLGMTKKAGELLLRIRDEK